MADQTGALNPSGAPTAMKTEKDKQKKRNGEFEFCKVCRINHDDGRRHNYIPRHSKSLSSLFSRFQKKVSDVRVSLKSPKFLLSEHASRSRIWCVFCEADIDELGSSFESGNAIRHLASEDHLKNLKYFLWKYGGGMNKVDLFRVAGTELSKVSPSDINRVADVGSSIDATSSSLPLAIQYNSSPQISTGLAGYWDDQHFLAYDIKSCSSYNHTSNAEVSRNQTPEGRTSSSQGFQTLTQVFARGPTEVKGNVHTGAPPPWFDATEAKQHNIPLHRAGANPTSVPPSKSVKSSKLNPKRVGAAWAEKRKTEMEMQRRGEISANVGGADWLPNFGRVWQSGSRKESKKEFEREKRKLIDAEGHSEALMKIQPYVSKRMRNDTNKGCSDNHAGNTADVF